MPVHQKKSSNVFEFCYGKVRGHHCLHAFLSSNSYPNMGRLNHVDIISSIANGERPHMKIIFHYRYNFRLKTIILRLGINIVETFWVGVLRQQTTLLQQDASVRNSFVTMSSSKMTDNVSPSRIKPYGSVVSLRFDGVELANFCFDICRQDRDKCPRTVSCDIN